MKTPQVSIAICTYNRPLILKLCLEHIKKHVGNFRNEVEVIVVENSKSDDSYRIFNTFLSDSYFVIRYYYESNIGLSYARNRAASEAVGDYIFYIDDDCLFQEDTMKELFLMIEEGYDVFGGHYEAYFLDPKPSWLNENFGTKKTIQIQKGPMLEGEKIEGGAMGISRSIFKIIGYFDPHFGMKGNVVGYSEETNFVNRAKDHQLKIGYNPFLKVHHIVGKHKYKVWWHLKSYYALSRDNCRNEKPLHISLWRTLILLPFRIMKYAIKLVMEKNYYYQNFIWNSFSGTFLLLGKLRCNIERFISK